MSQGEEIIESYLIDNKISFKREVEFSKYKFRLDFLCNFKDNLIAIEYHGIQHYIDGISDRPLEKQQNRDLFMREFCNKNKISLIEIDSRNYEYITSRYSNTKSKNNKYIFNELKDSIYKELDYKLYNYNDSDEIDFSEATYSSDEYEQTLDINFNEIYCSDRFQDEIEYYESIGII